MSHPTRQTIHSEERILEAARRLAAQGRLSRPNLKAALEELAAQEGHGRVSGDTARLAAVIASVRAEARRDARADRDADAGHGADPAELPPALRAVLEQLTATCAREIDAARTGEAARARLVLESERREAEVRYARLEADLAALAEEASEDAAVLDALRAELAATADRLAEAELSVRSVTRELADVRSSADEREAASDEERRRLNAIIESAVASAADAERTRREAEIALERARAECVAERTGRERAEAERDRGERGRADLAEELTAVRAELAEARAALDGRPVLDTTAVAAALRDLLASGPPALTGVTPGSAGSGRGGPAARTKPDRQRVGRGASEAAGLAMGTDDLPPA